MIKKWRELTKDQQDEFLRKVFPYRVLYFYRTKYGVIFYLTNKFREEDICGFINGNQEVELLEDVYGYAVNDLPQILSKDKGVKN